MLKQGVNYTKKILATGYSIGNLSGGIKWQKIYYNIVKKEKNRTKHIKKYLTIKKISIFVSDKLIRQR